MFDVFGWLRRKAPDAVLGGIADAVAKVAPGETAPTDLEGLRAMLAATDVKALSVANSEPAATNDEPTTAKTRKSK